MDYTNGWRHEDRRHQKNKMEEEEEEDDEDMKTTYKQNIKWGFVLDFMINTSFSLFGGSKISS